MFWQTLVGAQGYILVVQLDLHHQHQVLLNKLRSVGTL